MWSHVYAAHELQKKHPRFYLAGSAALILSDLLPNRPMSDLDFVLKHSDLPRWRNFFSNLMVSQYPKSFEDGYESYDATLKINNGSVKINLLVFDDNKLIRTTYVKADHLPIAIQNTEDIIAWKQKYNRPKDIVDLEAMSQRALEKALFNKPV